MSRFWKVVQSDVELLNLLNVFLLSYNLCILVTIFRNMYLIVYRRKIFDNMGTIE